MYLTEDQARTKWCPASRVDGSNRVNNTRGDGFLNMPLPNHCIAGECMAWREVHMSYAKAAVSHAMEGHGFCGLGGKPEFG